LGLVSVAKSPQRGHNMPAEGNALGQTTKSLVALKGRYTTTTPRNGAPKT